MWSFPGKNLIIESRLTSCCQEAYVNVISLIH